jgi:hypothetical protein
MDAATIAVVGVGLLLGLLGVAGVVRRKAKVQQLRGGLGSYSR